MPTTIYFSHRNQFWNYRKTELWQIIKLALIIERKICCSFWIKIHLHQLHEHVDKIVLYIFPVSDTSLSQKRSSATRPASAPGILSPRGCSPFCPQHFKQPWEGQGLRDKDTHSWTSFFSSRVRYSRFVMSLSLLPLSPCPLLNTTRRCCCCSFCRRSFWFCACMGRWEQRRRAAACPPPRPETMASPPRSESRQPPSRPPRDDF